MERASLARYCVAMSHEKLEAVREVIAAVNDRDLDRYLAYCTESIQLETPWAAVEGVYGGRGAIRRLFSDLGDTLPDLRLVIERLEPVGCDRVLAFIRANATGRASGTAAGSGALSATGPDIPSANVYDLAGVAVNRLSPLRPCVLGAARTWQRDSSAGG